MGLERAEEVNESTHIIPVMRLTHSGDRPGVQLSSPETGKEKNGSWRCTCSYSIFSIVAAELESTCQVFK